MNAITRRINPNRINHPINCETLNQPDWPFLIHLSVNAFNFLKKSKNRIQLICITDAIFVTKADRRIGHVLRFTDGLDSAARTCLH